jgi:MFS family permease
MDQMTELLPDPGHDHAVNNVNDRHFRRVPRSVMAAIAAAVTALAVTMVVAGGIAAPDTLVIGLAAVFYVGPGLVVLMRRDWHPIGWLLLLTGTAFAGQIGLSNAYPDGLASRLAPSWIAWMVEGWLINAVLAGVIAMIVIFPEGWRDRPSRQQLTGHTSISLAVAVVAAAMLTRTVGGGTQFPRVPNPTGIGFLPDATVDLTVPLQALLIAVSLAGFWLRFRHTTGLERARYRWVGYAFGLVIMGLVLAIFSPLINPASDLLLLPLLIAVYLVPISFSLAIVRYGLYEIDRIVSRTVTYGAVALVVALIYAVPVLSLPGLLGESNDLVIAASTLTAAAAFNPARRRIQTVVDRRFNRARFDAELQLDLFGSTLRSEVDLGAIQRNLHDLVTATIAPERMALWIR